MRQLWLEASAMVCESVGVCDLFGMVSSRDPNSKVVGDLQRLGIKLGHELNHILLKATK